MSRTPQQNQPFRNNWILSSHGGSKPAISLDLYSRGASRVVGIHFPRLPRIGRITVARGRDATDIPLATSFGPHVLKTFKVWTEEVGPAVLSGLTRRIA